MRKQDRVINRQPQNRPQQDNATPRPEQEQMKGASDHWFLRYCSTIAVT